MWNLSWQVGHSSSYFGSRNFLSASLCDRILRGITKAYKFEVITDHMDELSNDLMREMKIPCEISFVKLASYQGTTSTGKIKEVMGINEDISGRTIIILEDIVESGLTIRQMIDSLGTRNPASVHVCTLFFKPEKLKENLKLDYVAFEIPNDFILGYGLDYDQQGRGLKDLYTLVSE